MAKIRVVIQKPLVGTNGGIVDSVNGKSETDVIIDGTDIELINGGIVTVTEAISDLSIDVDLNNDKVSDINHVTIDLPNVDNTSDLLKPISNDTQTALDLKANQSDLDLTDTQVLNNVVSIDSLTQGQTGGLISFTTLAILQAYTDLGNNDSYKVTNDSTASNNGYYHWGGSAYVKDANYENTENYQDYMFTPLQTQMWFDGFGVTQYNTINNAAVSFGVVDNTLQIEVNGTGYAGIRTTDFPFDLGKDYYVSLEVKKISGNDDEWYIGDPTKVDGSVSFTPTTAWSTIKGKFNASIINTYGWFISGGVGLTTEIIQVKNVTISQRNSVDQDQEERIDVLEGGVNPNFDLQTEVNNKAIVFVPEGIHTLTTPLIVPSGRKIYGVKGKSIIQADANLTRLIEINSVNDITLEGLTIKGVAADTVMGGVLGSVGSGVVDTFDEAINENNVGTKTGIYLNASERINIVDCEISNFDAYGIDNYLCGKLYEYGIKVTDNYFHDNYCSLKTQDEAEYSSYLGNSFTKSQIGLRCETGNNIFSNNHIDKNRVGLVMTNGLNDSHGGFSNCTFNHNSLYGVSLDKLSNGEVFSACNIWYGNIYVRDSKGVNFNGCQIGLTNIFADGNFISGGIWKIQNSMFFGSSTIYQDHNGNTSNLSLKNNDYADGTSNTPINN